MRRVFLCSLLPLIPSRRTIIRGEQHLPPPGPGPNPRIRSLASDPPPLGKIINFQKFAYGCLYVSLLLVFSKIIIVACRLLWCIQTKYFCTRNLFRIKITIHRYEVARKNPGYSPAPPPKILNTALCSRRSMYDLPMRLVGVVGTQTLLSSEFR